LGFKEKEKKESYRSLGLRTQKLNSLDITPRNNVSKVMGSDGMVRPILSMFGGSNHRIAPPEAPVRPEGMCLKWRIHIVPQLDHRDVGLKKRRTVRFAPGVPV